MSRSLSYSRPTQFWLLLIPVVIFFYIGLFLTMALWYPNGLSPQNWQAHILNFSIIYLSWIVIFYANRLFDLESFRSRSTMLAHLAGSLALCVLAAVVYFYFQPNLLLTPRRFLLIHVALSGAGIVAWYIFAQMVMPRVWRSTIFAHDTLGDANELQSLLQQHKFSGLQYGGTVSEDHFVKTQSSIVVFPHRSSLQETAVGTLFSLRSKGVRFIEYHDLYEIVTRTIHLSALSELWFINSIDYGAHRLFDLVKRIIDVFLALLATILFVVTLPVMAVVVKLSSPGPIFFTQNRVGQNGAIFKLYKYRTMTVLGQSNTWTAPQDVRITRIGKFLRAARLDELPQSINVLKGEMSIVGPRPEQVHIVQELRTQIPYYDERHIVKPGLTGWAQLHVYASTVEETRQKLQYDLYYIKHRNVLFDAEIILKTVYNIITFSGR